jgi:hypothetical protein
LTIPHVFPAGSTFAEMRRYQIQGPGFIAASHSGLSGKS